MLVATPVATVLGTDAKKVVEAMPVESMTKRNLVVNGHIENADQLDLSINQNSSDKANTDRELTLKSSN